MPYSVLKTRFEAFRLARSSTRQDQLRAITVAKANERIAGLSQSTTGQNPVESAPDQEAGNLHQAKLAESQFIFHAPAGQKRKSHAMDRRSLDRLDVGHDVLIPEPLGLDPKLAHGSFRDRPRSRAGFSQISGSR